ncbi:MAG: kelch repeat-containing protein [Acidobacteriota bacterium]
MKPRNLFSSTIATVLLASIGSAKPYWQQGGSSPASLGARMGHAMAYDSARRRVVLFGGYKGAARQNDTWEWTGTSWAPGPAAPAALTPRYVHAMAYDASRQRVVLFGGEDGQGLRNDTWEYDGSAWMPGATAPGGLAPRFGHAMVYDASDQQVVLFGGYLGQNNYRKDTWIYDGNGWMPGPTAPAGLAARSFHAMAYDPIRGMTVLFGGAGISGNLDDTWLFDGAAWTAGPTAPAALLPREFGVLAFDALQGRLVLFGGRGSQTFDDTWSFDGSAWKPGAAPPAALTARYGHAMATDRGGAVLLYGGANGPVSLSDIWQYSGRIVDYVTGEGLGFPNPNRVRVVTTAGTATAVDFFAYSAGQYGVNVSAGSIDGSLEVPILTGPGPGAVYGPQVRAFRRDGTSIGKVNFYAYGTLKYGVNVTSAGLDGDSYQEIVTGPGPGVVFGPTVRGWNFDNASVTSIAKINYNAYAELQYGANVTAGDVDGDGFQEILTGRGPSPSFQPEIRGWNFDGTAVTAIAAIDFNAFLTPQYGVVVDSADVDPDSFGEILASKGPGAGLAGRFLGFNYDGTAVTALQGFDVTPFSTLYGGRPGDGEVTGDAIQEIIAGAGPDPTASSLVKPYSYDGTGLTPVTPTFIPFGNDRYGVNATSAPMGY